MLVELVMTKNLCILLFLHTFIHVFPQTNEINILAKKVNVLQEKRLSNYSTDSRDTVFTKFDSAIINLFQQKEFCSYQPDTSYYCFLTSDSISNYQGITLTYAFINYIVYTVSQDNKIRIFSWDNLDGGSYHTYTNFVQINTDNDQCEVVPFDTSELNAEVGYYRINQIDQGGKTFYLLFGHGTYGGGKHHKIAKIFYIENGVFTECFDCYPETRNLLIYSNRGQEIGLQFDKKQKKLTYKQFMFNDDMGFFTDDFVEVTYKFQNNKLIKE